MIFSRSVLCVASLLLVGLACPPAVRGNEAYYIILFGAQTDPPHPKYAHTWAAYVRAYGERDDPRTWPLAVHTNSWLPATLHVVVVNPCPQTGTNLDLQTTLNHVMSNGANITEWGPHQIIPEMYERGIRGIDRLGSGEIKWCAIDGFSRRSNVKNCFHSISDVLDRRDTVRSGKPGSAAAGRVSVSPAIAFGRPMRSKRRSKSRSRKRIRSKSKSKSRSRSRSRMAKPAAVRSCSYSCSCS
jgi:hypothetical protein